MSNEAPSGFITYNTQATKQINIVVQIEGVPGLLTAVPLYKRIVAHTGLEWKDEVSLVPEPKRLKE